MDPITNLAPPPQGENQSRRRLILEAAERLLPTRGFDGVRLRDISQEAGISIGMIQHYFPSRDDVIREALVTACERRASEWQLPALRQQEAPARIRALLTGAVIDRNHCAVWLEACAAASRHEEVQPVVTHTNNAWRKALAEAIGEGVDGGHLTPSLPVEHIVDIFVALIDGLILAVATRDPKITPDYTKSLLLSAARAQLGSDLPG